MQVKTRNATNADQLSAQALFDAMFSVGDVMWGAPASNLRVLDAFARNGQLTVQSYIHRPEVSRVDAWELGEEHRADLEQLGCSRVSIGCSYRQLRNVPDGTQYDLIVIDTPQGVHADEHGSTHVEHFDFYMESLRLLPQSGVVVLYVNLDPYDKNVLGEHGYDQYKEYDFQAWMSVREKFYGSQRPTMGEALNVYTKLAASVGLKSGLPLVVPCLSDVPGKAPYAFRVALPFRRG